MLDKKTKQIKFDYTWVIVALSFLMVFTVLGFCSSARSLYIAPICKALGVSRSAFSINDTCRYVTTAVINLFFGSLIARFGIKKLIVAGFGCLIASSLIYSFATNVYVFYIGGVFLGIGISWTTTTMVGAIVNKYCRRNRGTIMGFVLASNGVGAALAVQVLTPIIYREDTLFGYQDAYRLVSVILLVVALAIIFFFKDKFVAPSEEAAEEQKKKSRGQSWEGVPYSKAVKKVYFYGTLVCIFLTGMILQGISGVAAPHMSDVGLSAAFVASVLSIHSLALSGFKFLTGFIYDRFGLRITSNICLITSVIVMFLLAMVTPSPTGKVIAMIYGVFSSLSLPLETVMLPIYANDLFGDASFNKMQGLFSSANVAGFALGAPVANICYDVLGSYNVAFYAAGILMAIVTIAMHFVISSANREKAKIMNK